MKLVIGGMAQGKLSYVLNKYRSREVVVWDAKLPTKVEGEEEILVINQLHNWVKNCILQGGSPEEELDKFLTQQNECVFICDEIGNGIVPIEKEERAYREHVGRILVSLASKAEEVERILCGISQKIK